VIGTTTSGAEQLARLRPQARWVASFNTSPSESFDGVFAQKAKAPRPHLDLHRKSGEFSHEG
jgi:hypothetical protein